MKDISYYKDKEQTYLKHFVLEKYLEEVAIKIGMSHGNFVYVDSFSGPWRSGDEEYSDTSFVIAIERLRRAQNIVRRNKGPSFVIESIFVEKDPRSFAALQDVLSQKGHIKSLAINGEFEDLISEIDTRVGKSFLFLFVDPTGWRGFAMSKMRPLMRKKGEILINFMFDYINRFLDFEKQNIPKEMEELMGGAGWRDEISELESQGLHREEAILETYKERLRQSGGYKYVSSIRIMKPHSERSYFHLIYATENLAGIQAFSRVEKKFVEEQRKLRSNLRETAKTEKTNQMGLFGEALPPMRQNWFDLERKIILTRARERLQMLIEKNTRVQFSKLLGNLIEMPLVWESDVKQMIQDLERDSKIKIENRRPRQRVPHPEDFLIWLEKV